MFSHILGGARLGNHRRTCIGCSRNLGIDLLYVHVLPGRTAMKRGNTFRAVSV